MTAITTETPALKRSHFAYFPRFTPQAWGGVETYTESLARALADAGCKVTIATMNTHNAKSHERNGNVEIIRLPALNVLGGRYPLPKRNADYRAAMERLIESCPNYVVVNTRFYPLSLTGLSFARKLGIAPVLVEHGSAHLAMGGRATNAIVEAVEHAMTILDKLRIQHAMRCQRRPALGLAFRHRISRGIAQRNRCRPICRQRIST